MKGKAIMVTANVVATLDKLRGNKSYSACIEELLKHSSSPVKQVYAETLEKKEEKEKDFWSWLWEGD